MDAFKVMGLNEINPQRQHKGSRNRSWETLELREPIEVLGIILWSKTHDKYCQMAFQKGLLHLHRTHLVLAA